MKRIITLLLLFTIAFSLDCSDAGYKSYINSEEYSYKAEGSEANYEESYSIFESNCNKLNKRLQYGDIAEVTALLDWSESDLEQLGNLIVHYGGNAPYNEPVDVTKVQYRMEKPIRAFSEESLLKYSRKNPICSTSWATSVVAMAEAAVDNKYEFSVDQLLECMPEYAEMETVCNGVTPKDIMSYLNEVGLVLKDEFVDCTSSESKLHFKFESNIPDVPNASGLMNLIAEDNPVFVMLALNLGKLQFVKDMSNVEEPMKSASYQPSIYGIVSGYSADVDTPYWEITTHLIPSEKIVVRIPMTSNETNANYAGIAGYAFSLKWIKEDELNTFVKFIVDCYGFNNRNAWEIYDGETLLYQSPNKVCDNNQPLFTIETTLPYVANNQYTLKYKATSSIDYYSDTLTIEGVYGNRVFRGFLTKDLEEYTLSLYYGFMKNSEWKLIWSSPSDEWTSSSFDDASWNQVKLGSVTTAVSGTQYFRKQFISLTGMTAYELALNYRYGIVAYMNGVEIFRDNMDTTPITSTTPAINAYDSLSYHSVIRPGYEIETTQCVLAVELHFPTDVTQTTVDFDAYLAIYASNTVSEDSCYAYPYPITLVNDKQDDLDKLVDWNKNSYFEIINTEVPDSLLMTFGNYHPYFNGMSIFGGNQASYMPDEISLQGSNSDSDYINVIHMKNGVFREHEYSTFTSALFGGFRNYRIHLYGGTSWMFEFHPLICNIPQSNTIEYAQEEYSFLSTFESVLVKPINEAFTGCTINPEPASGLTFKSETCTLSGFTSEVLSSKEYTVTATINGKEYEGSFKLTTTECQGTVIMIDRWYTGEPEKEAYTLMDDITKDIVSQVNINSGHVAPKSYYSRHCLTNNRYILTLSSTRGYWNMGASIKIHILLSNSEYETILFVKEDTLIGLPSSYTFNPLFNIKPQESWYYQVDTVPENWYNSETTGWTLGNYDAYPETNKIQLYKKTFSVSSLEDISSIAMSIKYKYGVIVYLNGNEVFRKGFTGALTVDTRSTTTQSEERYYSIYIPIKSITTDGSTQINYVNTGSNTIAIALVATSDENTSSPFDCYMRLEVLTPYYRTFERDESSSSNLSFTTGHRYNGSFSTSSCDNYSNQVFKYDRHDCITSVVLRSYYLSETITKSPPTSVVIKAKNAEDNEWTILKEITGMVWTTVGEHKRIWLNNNKSYNQYRFENFCNNDVIWKLQDLDLAIDNTNVNVPDLSYSTPITLTKTVAITPIEPNTEYYTDFTVSPALPSGLSMDPYSGTISGSVDTDLTADTEYTISAKKFNTGELKSAVISFVTSETSSTE